MCVADIVILIIVCFTILNTAFLAIYCRLERFLERRREKRNNEVHLENQGSNPQPTNKRSFIKRLFSFLEPWLYGWMRYSTILVGKVPSHRLRNLIMRYVFCMQITRNTVIYGGCEIRSPWNITADRCVISTYCILDGRNGISFGEDVVLGGGVHIWTEEHNPDSEMFLVLDENKAGVIIDKHAWVCSDSTILPGVHVYEGAVIASRAVMTKDAEAFGIYAGVPARKIKERNRNLKYQLNGKPTWHFY